MIRGKRGGREGGECISHADLCSRIDGECVPSLILLGDFLSCVTAVNKIFNVRAGGDVACCKEEEWGGNDEFPHRLVLGKILSMQPFRLGLESKLLPFTLNEPDLAASNCSWFIMAMIISPSNTEPSNSILCVCCTERVKGTHLCYFKQIVPAWTFLLVFPFIFWSPLHCRDHLMAFLW